MLLPMRSCLVAYLVCLSWCVCLCLSVLVRPWCVCVLVPCCIVPMRHGCLVSVLPRALFFSAVQMNNGSKSVRTVRRMCHGLPLRVGFI